MTTFKPGDLARVVEHGAAGYDPHSAWLQHPVGAGLPINENGRLPGGWLPNAHHKVELVKPAPAVFADADHADHHAPEDEAEPASLGDILGGAIARKRAERDAKGPRDIGLEFLMSEIATFLPDPDDDHDTGYMGALRNLAAAYGKTLQHVNRMEIVDA